MLDPITALGIASAVTQFIDYGGKIIGTTYQLYKSTDGAVKENVVAEKVVADLESLSGRLGTLSNAPLETAFDCERKLQTIARECHRLSQTLLQIFVDLRKKTSDIKTWDALRRAVLLVRKKEAIQRLQQTLDRLTADLSIHLLDTLRQNQSSMLLSIRQLSEASQNMQLQNATRLQDLKEDLLNTLTDPIHNASAQYEWLQQSFDTVLARLDDMCRSASTIAESKALLDSLRFKEMPMRYIQIPVAYAHTYGWILRSSRTPFKAWLEKSSGVFWISGTAGSGKSTLVKFLAGHPQTRASLGMWADVGPHSNSRRSTGRGRLAIASYYFWKSGYPMQKSLKGLYQCLLLHILTQCTSLIPLARAHRRQQGHADERLSDPWTQQELSATMDVLLDHTPWPSRFCFFIDGLDEYAGTADEQYAMVQDLNRLAASPHVKICVSSRPWNVSRAAYDSDASRKLVLQDHNKADLDTYIHGKLESDPRFLRLAQVDERAKEFAIKIRTRANGVFLWVFLVVRSLLDGLTEDDDITMLEERLQALPPTLEDYFDLMLKSIDSIYKCYTARALLLACNATQPLPALSYYYLQAEMGDPDYALSAPIRPAATHEVESRRKSVVAWINKWCRDFLEVNPRRWGSQHLDTTQEHRVEFIHRTARDFLAAEDMQALFQRDAGSYFNTRLSLCRSYLVQAKNLNQRWRAMTASSDFLTISGYLMFHAKEHEAMDGKTPFALLEELDRVGTISAESNGSMHWTSYCPRFEQVNIYARESNFLAHAIEFDLQLYVEQALDKISDDIVKLDGAPLLEFAMRPTLQHEVFAGVREPLQDIVSLLIRRGAVMSESRKVNLLGREGVKCTKNRRLRLSADSVDDALEPSDDDISDEDDHGIQLLSTTGPVETSYLSRQYGGVDVAQGGPPGDRSQRHLRRVPRHGAPRQHYLSYQSKFAPSDKSDDHQFSLDVA
ncbi:hypothetical protein LTR85_003536 [Meristemomyces frigidus]|nr:hypothetical protein LTR85_003536 [Meristemomyces frigidus]